MNESFICNWWPAFTLSSVGNFSGKDITLSRMAGNPTQVVLKLSCLVPYLNRSSTCSSTCMFCGHDFVLSIARIGQAPTVTLKKP